jgi:ABC-type sugar transport system ATPase subunit
MNREVPHDLAEIAAVPALLLEAHELRRTFGETVALDSCSLQIRAGEIHAVVGENGSGKSTLIKILSGIMPTEAGTLAWAGKPAAFHSPRAAQQAGIASVFQETLVLTEMTIRDNVMLGADGLLRRNASSAGEIAMVREALAVLGLERLGTERLVGTLSLANRQLVGVARALSRPWRLLILDESTSAIDIEERDRLFQALRGFSAAGRSVLFVSHRMDEIESLADRTTVLRSGRSVATLVRGEFNAEKLLQLMSTREGAAAAEGHGSKRTLAKDAGSLIGVRGFALKDEAPRFDFEIRSGEIIGVGGLEGHGQVAFLECVAGLRRAPFGVVEADGSAIRSRGDAERARIAFLPRDRKTEGIFAPLSVMDNVAVSSLRRLARFGVIRSRQRAVLTDETCGHTKVKMASRVAPISSLSGGNQQKALIGRLLATRPRVLVLNDPLRGVDLGAKRDLYDVLTRLADNGMAILLLSTELVELCLLCNRVVVFHDHRVSAVVDRHALDEQILIAAMFGRRTGNDAKGAAA